MTRTSSTHPLQIQSVTPAGTTGAIGMTLCPGHRGPSNAYGHWNRDLATDLEAVRDWKPDLVITLLEDKEFAVLRIPRFRDEVAESRIPWEFAPIRDVDIPDAAFERTWRVLGPRARNILRKGGRVLIHCRAGLGRTGLLAATLLVELGASPESAIAAVRHARPGTIQTDEQEDYVHGRRPLPEDPK